MAAVVKTAERTDPGWALGLGGLAIFLSSVSAAIITIALQPIVTELHAGQAALIWLSLAYLVPYAAVLPAAGKLADVFGHRPVLLGSLALFTAGSALAAGVPSGPYNVASLVLFRVIAGVGGAGLMISLAWVVTAWQGPRQGLAVGVWRALLLAGTVGGPPLGGALTAWLGWRSIFWLPAIFGLVGLLLAWPFLNEPTRPAEDRRSFDWTGAVATVVGLSALIVAMNDSGLAMGVAPGMAPVAATAAVTPQVILLWALWAIVILAALSVWRSVQRQPNAIVTPALFGIPRFAFANTATLLICVGMFSSMFFVPLFLQYQQRFTPLAAAGATLPITVTALLFGIGGGWLADRWGLVLPSFLGFLLLGMGFTLLAQLRPDTPYWFTFIALVLSGSGMSLPLAPTALAAITSVPAEAEGEAAGLFNLAHNLGRPLGLAVFGVVLQVQSAASFATIFWLSAITAVLGMVAALGLAAPGRSVRRPAEAGAPA